MSELIAARELCKSYKKGDEIINVLQGTTFSIPEGSMVSIIGASGAGKSTLLHLLGTLDAPDSGDIIFRGKSLTGMNASELADFRNNTLGFVFQFHHLLSEFTALENVMMPALIRRNSKNEAQNLAARTLTEVGLAKRMLHKPGELSGGEQQRVALARALVLSPQLILADEVTGNLDERNGEEIHELLFTINRERGATLVVVTHNRSLADRMPLRLELKQGSVKERR
ncbi:MAG: ABC transporter ATP-binding protein [Deltaproteobacteria bacterium]|nr:ABC transporter ATP-binding protein [Deltaproteobacteria bacterium]